MDPKDKFYRHFRDSIEGGLLLLAYMATIHHHMMANGSPLRLRQFFKIRLVN